VFADPLPTATARMDALRAGDFVQVAGAWRPTSAHRRVPRSTDAAQRPLVRPCSAAASASPRPPPFGGPRRPQSSRGPRSLRLSSATTCVKVRDARFVAARDAALLDEDIQAVRQLGGGSSPSGTDGAAAELAAGPHSGGVRRLPQTRCMARVRHGSSFFLGRNPFPSSHRFAPNSWDRGRPGLATTLGSAPHPNLDSSSEAVREAGSGSLPLSPVWGVATAGQTMPSSAHHYQDGVRLPSSPALPTAAGTPRTPTHQLTASNMAATERSTVEIQAAVRGRQTRQTTRRQSQRAAEIQAAERGRQARRLARARQQSAIDIQRSVRGRQSRQQVARMEKHALLAKADTMSELRERVAELERLTAAQQQMLAAQSASRPQPATAAVTASDAELLSAEQEMAVRSVAASLVSTVLAEVEEQVAPALLADAAEVRTPPVPAAAPALVPHLYGKGWRRTWSHQASGPLCAVGSADLYTWLVELPAPAAAAGAAPRPLSAGSHATAAATAAATATDDDDDDGDGEWVAPTEGTGTLQIYVGRCTSILPRIDAVGGADPYVTLTVGGHSVRTGTVQNDSSAPEWNQALTLTGFPLHSPAPLLVQLWDEDPGKHDNDDLMAAVSVDLRPYVPCWSGAPTSGVHIDPTVAVVQPEPLIGEEANAECSLEVTMQTKECVVMGKRHKSTSCPLTLGLSCDDDAAPAQAATVWVRQAGQTLSSLRQALHHAFPIFPRRGDGGGVAGDGDGAYVGGGGNTLSPHLLPEGAQTLVWLLEDHQQQQQQQQEEEEGGEKEEQQPGLGVGGGGSRGEPLGEVLRAHEAALHRRMRERLWLRRGALPPPPASAAPVPSSSDVRGSPCEGGRGPTPLPGQALGGAAVRRAFAVRDADESGLLRWVDFHAALDELGLELSAQEVEEVAATARHRYWAHVRRR
jgi:hypothetical protein